MNEPIPTYSELQRRCALAEARCIHMDQIISDFCRRIAVHVPPPQMVLCMSHQDSYGTLNTVIETQQKEIEALRAKVLDLEKRLS